MGKNKDEKKKAERKERRDGLIANAKDYGKKAIRIATVTGVGVISLPLGVIGVESWKYVGKTVKGERNPVEVKHKKHFYSKTETYHFNSYTGLPVTKETEKLIADGKITATPVKAKKAKGGK